MMGDVGGTPQGDCMSVEEDTDDVVTYRAASAWDGNQVRDELQVALDDRETVSDLEVPLVDN